MTQKQKSDLSFVLKYSAINSRVTNAENGWEKAIISLASSKAVPIYHPWKPFSKVALFYAVTQIL